MENVIITLILTMGAVVITLFTTKTLVKYRETNAEDLKKEVINAKQRVQYWKGKFNALDEETEDLEDLANNVDLGDLGDLADLEKIPVIGKLLKNPKYAKLAQAFLQGASQKQQNKKEDQPQQEFIF